MKVHYLSVTCSLLFFAICPVASYANEPGSESAPSSIEQHQQRISDLQMTLGPYDEGLIQPTLDMAFLLNENNQLSKANETFESALQLYRINYGLQDLKQTAILDVIIGNNLKQQDWRTANNNFHKLHWVNRRNYAANDPEMLQVLDRLIAWHLLAINLKTGLHPGEHFLKLLELNHRTLEIVDNDEKQDRLALAQRLYKLALIHYYIAVAVQRGDPVGEFLLAEFNPLQLNESYQSASVKLVKKMFIRSRKLMTRIASLYQDVSPSSKGSRAIAQLYLADWDLLFNRHANANRGFKNTYDILIGNGYSRAMVNSFFSRPLLLPTSEFKPDLMVKHSTQAIRDDDISDNEKIEFVGWSKALPGVKYPAADIKGIVKASTERFSDVSFDVLKDGLTKNIVISRGNKELSLPRRTAYEAIWSAQFRPRLLDGKAVAVSGMSTRFYLPSLDAKK